MAKEFSREELAELLAGIIADNRENPPRNVVKLCNKCRRRSATTCKTYPNGIPKKILIGNDCPDYEPKESGAGR